MSDGTVPIANDTAKLNAIVDAMAVYLGRMLISKDPSLVDQALEEGRAHWKRYAYFLSPTA